MASPHYLRFAQALALCSGLASVSGCPSSTTRGEDAGPAGVDAPTAPTDAPGGADAPTAMLDAPPGTTDAPEADDAGDPWAICGTCECWGPLPVDGGDTDAGRPDCLTVPGAEVCCAAVGPLLPPDLPA